MAALFLGLLVNTSGDTLNKTVQKPIDGHSFKLSAYKCLINKWPVKKGYYVTVAAKILLKWNW